MLGTNVFLYTLYTSDCFSKLSYCWVLVESNPSPWCLETTALPTELL